MSTGEKLEAFLKAIERRPLDIAMARIEATRYTGEDGKEYCRLELERYELGRPQRSSL